jgi:hypothetical protein
MLATLENAQPTLHNLHTAAMLLGAVRVLVFERQSNYLELGMKVVPDGISTDMLPNGGEVTLDFRQLALNYQPADGAAVRIPITGQTQVGLLETLLSTIYANELAAQVPHAAGETYTDASFRANAVSGRVKLHREHLSGADTLEFDAAAARDYADALYAIFTGIARFKARLSGNMTPAVVWNEHFDLSTLWFAGEADERHPHLNFGFAPYSYGIDYPYLYAYAYPYPDQYTPPTLPTGARWNTEGWTGVVLTYAEIARQDNPAGYVEAACTAIFKALGELL